VKEFTDKFTEFLLYQFRLYLISAVEEKLVDFISAVCLFS